MDTARRSNRLPSLDGLRGLAALVVVVHHCALTVPALAAQMFGPDNSSPAWWLAWTPAYLLWAGREAVLVFFVLSGFVLSLPRLSGGKSGRWASYYRKRMVRLYVPVVAAVALSGLLVALVPRPSYRRGRLELVDVDAHRARRAAGAGPRRRLVTGSGWVNSALWSLKYEVLFSLLLPVVVLVARRVVLPLWLSLPAVLAGIGLVTAVGWGTASYLGVFVVGVLLAQPRQTLTGWAGRVQALRAGGVVEAAVLLLAGGLLLSEIWLGLAVVDPWLCGMLGRPGAVLGAALLVVCCLHAPGMRRLMSTRPLHWLGTVSFALYLVHEPIVVSIAAVVGPTAVGVTLTLVGGTLGSLGAAVLFHHVVEKPSMRLADRLGRRGLRPASPVLTSDHVAATDTVLLGRGRSCSSATTARVPARAR